MGSDIQRRILGPRPAKWNFGMAVAQAADGAGKYFNQVAIEKANAEALEAANNFTLMRDENNQEFQIEQAKARRAEELTDQQTAAAQEEYRYNRGREDQLEDQADADARGAISTATYLEDIPFELIPEGMRGFNPKTPMEVRRDSDGNVVQVMGRDTDWVEGPDGTFGKASAGARGSTNSRTEAQIKYGIHGRNLESGINNIMNIIGVGDGSDGKYDLSSWEAAGEALANKFGTFGNFAKSSEGRRYRAALTRAAEALFKGESGAAGSDQEAARYQSMFPSPFDDPATVQMKLEMLEVSRQAFQEASNAGMSLDDTVNYTRNRTEDLAIQRGFDLDTGTMFSDEPVNSPAGTTPTITDEDKAFAAKYNITLG